MRDRPDDLIAVGAITLILLAIIAIVPDNPARTVLGLIFILALPGYAATAALFPGKGTIDLIERVALSIGLSIAIVSLSGLALNYTPFGIRLEPILATVSGFILIASIVAWRRRMYLPADERFRIDIAVDLGMKGMPMVDRALTVGIAVTLAATLILLAYVIAVPRSGESFTQLALLGPDHTASGYPRNLSVGEEAAVIVSIKSFENDLRNYSLVISLQNSTDNRTTHWTATDPFSATLSMDRGLASARNFSLDPEEWMNATFNFSVSQTGVFKLRFMLFLQGEPLTGEPYREVYLWLNVGNV